MSRRMKMNKIYMVLLFLGISFSGFSQEKVKVISAVSQDNTGIIVKWYGKHVFTGENINIYRTETNNETWTKLNTAPIGKKTEIPQTLLDKDEAFVAINNSIARAKPEDLNGFLVLIVMIKSVEYPEFADYLGIRFFDKTVVKGKSYQYKIVNEGSNILGISDPVVFNTFIPLNPPDSVQIRIEDNVPLISWQPDENKFFGYFVYRSETKGGKKTRITDQPIIVTKNSDGNFPKYLFVDDTMRVGETYFYNVVGIDYFGRESRRSKELVAVIKDVVPPLPPTSLKATVSGKKILLFWETDNVPDLAGYNIYRSTIKDMGYKKINTTLLDKKYQVFNDTASNVGVLYYKVASVDTAGNEAFSFVEPAEIRDVFPPEKPTGVICQPDTGKIYLSWKPNAERDLDGYLIYRTVNKNDNSKYILLNKKPVITNQFTDILPKEAKNKFYYKVVAIDTSSNRSSYSDFAVTGMPDILPPKKPVIKAVIVEDDNLQIEWFPNFENDLKGYNIYRKAKNDSTGQNKKLNISPINKNVTVFTDLFAKPGIEYRYSIIAFDTSGNSSAVSDFFPAVLPGKSKSNLSFTGFKASLNKGKKQVKLTWKIKRAENINGYMIYRKAATDTRLKPITGLINVEEYTDKNVSNNQSYTYQIRAFTKTNIIIKSAEKTININIENK